MAAENARKMYAATAAPTQTASAAIKRENGIQLSSLKPVRDLTLGGRGAGGGGAVKKEFKPNLNVVRNKNANVKTSKDTSGRGRGGRGRGERGGRGGAQRGRGGANSMLIQTSGVFSEGAGALNIRKNAFGSSSYSRNADDTPSAMRKPTLIKNELKKIDLHEEETQMRELLGDSDDDRCDLMYDKTDLEQTPIKLQEAKWKKIKQEIKVEKTIENGDDAAAAATLNDEAALAVANKLQAMHVKQEEQRAQQQASFPRYPGNMLEFLQATQPQLFVIQLPDVLPTCDDDADGSGDVKPDKLTIEHTSISSNTTDNPLNSTPASSIRSKSNSLLLLQTEEGQVGKLVRYKSGKMKLILGETQFDIEMGMETGFLQELMSITTIREERQGSMINLGQVQAKLTATPDWELLLNDTASTAIDRPC